MAQIRPILDDDIRDIYFAPRIYGFPLNMSRMMPGTRKEGTLSSSFDHDLESVRCYKGDVLLEDCDIRAEYTVTEHCALYRFTYPDRECAFLRVSVKEPGHVSFSDGLVHGFEEHFGIRFSFAAVFSEEPAGVEDTPDGILIAFRPGICLTVKTGFSLIDEDQAMQNLKNETDGLPFDTACEKAQAVWDEALSRIEAAGGSEKQRRIFYTALYRVCQRMINISEYGRYFSPFDHKLHSDARPFYTNDGIWDTYRGAHPLQLLLEPARQSDIIDSYIRMYRQCGHMPTFPALEGSRPVMIGKHTTAMITDAYIKGLRGFDIEEAWKGMVHNEEKMTKLPWTLAPVNEYDKCYFEKGFFPALPEGCPESLPDAHPFERRQCVTVTLETCYDEWCLSRLGAALGKKEAAKYAARACNYAKVFNQETGFMSPRLADGSWVPGFDPKLSGGQGGRAYFAECNSWIYTLHVQHDIPGLTELMGGRDKLEAYLDRLFTEPCGTSKFAFLGQFPDATGLMGQFCMGNEPAFHIPYLYNYTASPWKAQRKLRELMRLWFDDTPFGICGDEDGGAMSAWYVFSAMGFYPTCPGRPEYDIGSPIFDKITLHLPESKTFVIEADGNSPRAKYIAQARLNGKEYGSTRLAHSDIVSGGTLWLRMSERPNKYGCT